MAAATLLSLGLGGCGNSSTDAGNSDAFDPTSVEVPEFAPRDEPDAPPDGLGSGGSSVPALTLASGPDVCFREIAKKFGPDIKVAEITSFFSAGEAIAGRSSEPRGQMTTCTVSFQNPSDPRKLLTASFNTRTGTFGEPSPVEITVMGNAANFRLADYVVPLSRVNAAALTGVMSAQEKRLKSVYGDYAWSGVRLSGPDAFSRTHTLRLDLDGRLAANDIKDGGLRLGVARRQEDHRQPFDAVSARLDLTLRAMRRSHRVLGEISHDKYLAIAAAAALAAGPATAANKVKYDCKGGTTLTVTFKDGKARVSVPGAEPLMLSQGPSGDGFLYTKKGYSLRGVGNKVTWTTGPRQVAELQGALGSRRLPKRSP